MKNSLSQVVLIILLININAEHIQNFYRNYLCDYDRELVVFAGKKITVCGATCDITNKESPVEMDQRSQNVQPNISPFYLPISEINTSEVQAIKIQEFPPYIDLYSFTTTTSLNKPPIFIG